MSGRRTALEYGGTEGLIKIVSWKFGTVVGRGLQASPVDGADVFVLVARSSGVVAARGLARGTAFSRLSTTHDKPGTYDTLYGTGGGGTRTVGTRTVGTV